MLDPPQTVNGTDAAWARQHVAVAADSGRADDPFVVSSPLQ
jgi:hypothetical protein